MLIRIQIIAQVLKVYHKHTVGLALRIAWGCIRHYLGMRYCYCPFSGEKRQKEKKGTND